MAKKPTKFRTGGSSDRSQARFDRKVADIDSDLTRALRGASEREAEVARAKHRQRMADARDDLAKWTGGDRTQTRAAERGAEAELTRTRRQGATFKPNVEAPAAKPVSSAQIAAATPSTTPTAKAPSGSRSTPTRRTPAKPRSGGSDAVRREVQQAATQTVTRQAAAPRSTVPGASTLTPEQQSRAAAYRAAFQGRRAPAPAQTPAPDPRKPRRATLEEVITRDPFGNPIKQTPEQRRRLEAAVARTGTRTSFAKGGSVDGIAIRGKTRAKRKK